MKGRTRELDVTVGPWARDKLQALGDYLEYFNTRLKFQPWLKATLFIDGFAGAGYSKIRSKADPQPLLIDMPDQEQSELIAGSPRVALELKTPFDYYLFIEQDALRAAELEKLIEAFPNRNITVRLGDAGSVISAVISKRKSWSKYRGVAFLDPFGTHLPWATIEQLAATKAFEVLINFPLQMAIQRLIPREGEIDEEWRGHFDTYFGTPDWFNEVYEEADGLFGGQLVKRPDYSQRLLRFYLSRLEAAFGHVSPAKLICNTKKRPLYYLVWAGPHPAGLTGAKHILSKGEHVGR
jgi:three-Cys-motif partner protein